jgi:hypothetical protein
MAGGSAAQKETWIVWPWFEVAVAVVALLRSATYASRSRRIDGGRRAAGSVGAGGENDSGKIIEPSNYGVGVGDHGIRNCRIGWETEEFYVPKLATRFGFLFFSWAVLG